jgi:ABC-2 type transport system ATP-binding protein
MISIQHLTKRFATTTAVHDLSLEIHAGEIFGLIGPDGAGKTTTLRLIATALNPTLGRVMVDGIETTRDPEAVKKIIGYMPQRFALYPDLTVVENLNFLPICLARRAPRAPNSSRACWDSRALTNFARASRVISPAGCRKNSRLPPR